MNARAVTIVNLQMLGFGCKTAYVAALGFGCNHVLDFVAIFVMTIL
jgi:hypothetical protein